MTFSKHCLRPGTGVPNCSRDLSGDYRSSGPNPNTRTTTGVHLQPLSRLLLGLLHRSNSDCSTPKPPTHSSQFTLAVDHQSPPTTAKMGRVRTKTVKKSAKVIIERYYPKLTLDFETNKRICDEIAIIASKRLRNKVRSQPTRVDSPSNCYCLGTSFRRRWPVTMGAKNI